MDICFLSNKTRFPLNHTISHHFTQKTLFRFPNLVEETRAVQMESVKIHRNSAQRRFFIRRHRSSSLVGMLQCLESTRTFSVGFEVPGYSKLEHARNTPAFLGTEHYEVSVSAQSYLEHFPTCYGIWMNLLLILRRPVFISFVSELASRQVKVVFSREAADEFFGGYNIYRSRYHSECLNIMLVVMRAILRVQQLSGMQTYQINQSSVGRVIIKEFLKLTKRCSNTVFCMKIGYRVVFIALTTL